MMTPEQRLDRLERIAKLFVTAGLRARRNMRDLDERISIIVDSQIANEERFAALAEAQAHPDKRLDALIDIVRDGRNGNSKEQT
jgi:hypothetical protein